jgi:hypothetical protein
MSMHLALQLFHLWFLLIWFFKNRHPSMQVFTSIQRVPSPELKPLGCLKQLFVSILFIREYNFTYIKRSQQLNGISLRL